MPDNETSMAGWSSPVRHYVIAFAGVSTAILLRQALTPVIGSDAPLLTFFVPVLAMAWYLDFWPTVLATVLSAAAVIVITPPASTSSWTGWARLAVFVVMALTISYLNAMRRAAARAQERQAHMLQTVLQQMPLGIVLAEAPSGKLLMSNSRLEQMLGGPIALAPNIEAYGEYKGFHLNGKQYTADENPMARAIRSGDLVEDEEFYAERGDGTYTLLRVRAAPVRDPSGRIIAGVAALVDVTENKRIDEQLRQNAELLDIAYDAIIVLSPDGAVELWSDGAARLYGWTKQEAIGQRVHLLLKTQFPEPLNNINAKLHAEGRWEGELTHTTQSGLRVVVSSRWALRRDLTGKAAGWLEINRDITANKQAESVIMLMAGIVESSEDAIISKDLDGWILTWNAAAERIYGYTSGEAVGRSIEILLPPDRAREERDILERLRRGERIEHFETKRVRKDGTQIHVSLTISPIRDRAGTIIGASHTARDITEQKQFQEQLRHTQKLESLGVLAAGVAHDFNNLLTGIMGNASLLASNMPEGSANAEFAQTIVEASARAADLTSQLLGYAGKRRFLMEAIDCSELVRDISALISSSIPKGVQLHLKLAEQLPTIIGDASQ
ncbi:MAG: sensor hybrid histidine kinase, partial [Bryobacterales bacterium]|nr:sensor hybrid histidine kinase [Bryobacterales bacterium]